MPVGIVPWFNELLTADALTFCKAMFALYALVKTCYEFNRISIFYEF